MWYLMEDIGGWRRKCRRRGGMIEGGVYGKCWDRGEKEKNA